VPGDANQRGNADDIGCDRNEPDRGEENEEASKRQHENA
jgi:hypothetical protein